MEQNSKDHVHIVLPQFLQVLESSGLMDALNKKGHYALPDGLFLLNFVALL